MAVSRRYKASPDMPVHWQLITVTNQLKQSKQNGKGPNLYEKLLAKYVEILQTIICIMAQSHVILVEHFFGEASKAMHHIFAHKVNLVQSTSKAGNIVNIVDFKNVCPSV